MQEQHTEWLNDTNWILLYRAIIVITVISIAPYLADKGEHITLYKILKNVYIII